MLAADHAAVGGLEDAGAPAARRHPPRQPGIHSEGDLVAHHGESGAGPRALRAQGVEGGRAPGQHVLAPLFGQADERADNGERQHLRQFADRLEGVALHQGRDQRICGGFDLFAHVLHGAGAERRAEGGAQGVVRRRVAGDDGPAHAGVGRHVGAWAPGRREQLMAGQGRADVGIAPHRPDPVAGQPDDGARIADIAIVRIGLGDHRLVEQVDVHRRRRAGRRRAKAERHSHDDRPPYRRSRSLLRAVHLSPSGRQRTGKGLTERALPAIHLRGRRDRRSGRNAGTGAPCPNWAGAFYRRPKTMC